VRGRAGSAALPALVVLVLVAIVAVAATGSVPRGSTDSRAPSDTFLDTLFTLWIVAVVAGGVLVVYGLMQRQAIAKQMASGRYPRLSLVGWVVIVALGALAYWAFRKWSPAEQEPPDEQVFGGPPPVIPTTPEDGGPVRTYEPGLSGLPIVVVVGLVVAAAIAYVVASRRARRARDPQAELAEELAATLDDALDDLRAEADPRRAIIAAYARMERVLAASGSARLPAETPDEYLARVLRDLELTPDAVGRLTALFTQAKFSHHDLDNAMKESAIAALEQVRDELRSLRAAPAAPSDASPTPEVVTS